MHRIIPVVVILSTSILPCRSLARPQKDDDGPAAKQKTTLMDDPRDEDALRRQIWESIKHTPYAKALAYAQAAQKASRAAAAPATVTLPTGWQIAPAGTQVSVGTLPFDAIVFNGSVVVVDSGSSDGPQDFRVIDPTSAQVLQTISLRNVYPGAASGPSGSLYISGGFSKQVYRYDTNYNLAATYELPGYVRGLAGYDSRYLVATYTESPVLGGLADLSHVVMIDTTTGNIIRDTGIGINDAYAVSVVQGLIYVTIPTANQVVVLDSTLNVLSKVSVGRSPLSACQDGSNLYVVDENSDDVAVINASTNQVASDFPVKFWGQNWGAGPTSCAVDNSNLYVTLSQANAVAVLNKTNGQFEGYIPTGWYPTKVLALSTQLAMVSAKGIQPRRPNSINGIDVLNLLQGTVGFLPKAQIPANLIGWTLQVSTSAPFAVLPSLPSANIKHVFFIVKENRTFDQVLGDLGRGNGDPSLVNFGASVTPIQHYLAQEFITLDNLYVDGEVSTTGHSITTSSYASPYLQLITSLDYSGRLEANSDLVPGGFSPAYIWDALGAQNIRYRIFGEAEYFQSLYLLVVKYFGPQSALAAKLRYFASPAQTAQNVSTQITNLFAGHLSQTTSANGMKNLLSNPQFGQAFSEVLTGDSSLYQATQTNSNFFTDLINYLLHFQFNYSVFNLNVSDLDRAAAWMRDFALKDALGLVEPFQYLTLPNDHTGGNSLGLTATQQVAENDAALDLILRTLTKSRIWSHSIVFVIEDDAQSGLDHVDATRTTGFVVSPWVKHNVVISDRFDQLSMVRTIGLLLGLNPLSVNDALAMPMFSIFSPPFSKPNLEYNPPPVSGQLSAADMARYSQLLGMIH